MLLGDAGSPALAGKPRLLGISELDELVSGPREAKAYGRMLRAVGEALGPVKAVKPPPFPIDELYWTTRRLQAHEAWAAHGEWISVKGRRIGQAIYDRFVFGKTVTRDEVASDKQRRDAFRAALADLLGNDGVLVLPTVPCAAPLSASTPDELGAFRERAIRQLMWSGLSGFPQISLPLGTVEGAPFGISLLGPAGSDRVLIRLGRGFWKQARGDRMDTLTRMRGFIDVVEAEGFSAAARKIGRSKALLSKYVRELEDELGALLLNRTTRQFSLTEAGHTYYKRASEIVREVDSLADAVRESSGDVRGRIKLSAPRTFADAPIGQSLIDFAVAHPEIVLEVKLDDRFVDLVEEGFDLAVRITRLENSSLIARRLLPFAIRLCARRR